MTLYCQCAWYRGRSFHGSGAATEDAQPPLSVRLDLGSTVSS